MPEKWQPACSSFAIAVKFTCGDEVGDPGLRLYPE